MSGGSIAKQLRAGIIDKLKEFDCYIDNDLPDYIMVLIANKKTSNQMKDDLSLFIGDNVAEFVDWLHDCLDIIKLGNDPFVKPSIAHSSKTSTEIDKVNKQESIKTENPIVKKENVLIKKTSNDETKENTKDKSKRLHREIKFTDDDRIKFDDDRKETKIEPTSLTRKSQYKLIVFDKIDDSDRQQPVKRFKNQIILDKATTSTNQSHSSYHENVSTYHNTDESNGRKMISTISQQHHSQNNFKKPANYSSRLPSNQMMINQVSKSNFNQNKSYSNHHSNIHQSNNDTHNHQIGHQNNQINNHQNNFIGSNQLRSLNQRLEARSHIPSSHSNSVNLIVKNETPRTETMNAKSLVIKAVAEANKQSNLTSISIRKSGSESPPKSLINRLGMGIKMRSSSPAKIEKKQQPPMNLNKESTRLIKKDDDQVRKERRLAKFNQIKIESKQIELNRSTSLKKESIKQETNSSININPPSLEPDDLRFRLSKKRKLTADVMIEDQNAVRIDESRKKSTIKISNDEDEELRTLRSQIKSKTVLSESKKDENHRKDADHSDIIKRELLEKMEAIKATVDEQRNKLKLSGKDPNQVVSTVRKERCHFWPVCSNQDCQYHHPNALCLKFPNCVYGSNCLNIHPNCRFDSKCINTACPYTHLTRKLVKKPIVAKNQLLSTIQKIQPIKK